MSMGMSVNLGLLFDQPIVYLAIAASLVALKAAILFPLALLFGLKRKFSTAVALLLAQSGEFAMVLFALANQNGFLTEILFQQLLLIVLLTIITTPVLAQMARQVSSSQQTPDVTDNEGPSEAQVVLAGFGRVGHRIGEILQEAKITFVALDCDPAVVAVARKKGQPVYYGDVCQPGILRAVGAAGSQVIIVTLNNPSSTRELVTSLRELYPGISIFARGHNLEVCRELSRLGASGVVSENIEASLVLARMTLAKIGADETSSEEMLLEFQRKYEEQINQARHFGHKLGD
jgi:voltage-gated potassium channel Kch/multisubunit Na+/H+ antiporter MnhG subunit